MFEVLNFDFILFNFLDSVFVLWFSVYCLLWEFF